MNEKMILRTKRKEFFEKFYREILSKSALDSFHDLATLKARSADLQQENSELLKLAHSSSTEEEEKAKQNASKGKRPRRRKPKLNMPPAALKNKPKTLRKRKAIIAGSNAEDHHESGGNPAEIG
jgi:hypothetical protein